MVAFRWLRELRKSGSVLAPVEFAAVNDNTSNGCTVSTNPLGSTVYNDVGPMVDGPEIVATSTKCVINLKIMGELVTSSWGF